MLEDKGQCVQCGFCCTVGNCVVGEWDAEKLRCKFLTDDNLCGKYNEILERSEARFAETQNENDLFFHTGCSSTLCNTVRDQRIQELQGVQGV